MAAGVMRDWRRPDADRQRRDGARLDPARLRLPQRRAAQPAARAASPTRSARPPRPPAFDRATFLSVGGFDESLFAYWEDVDLVLRLRRLGLRCALAPEAIGDHEHSATLGSGSARKNYLMGYGRGYVLRKWGVLTPAPASGRAPARARALRGPGGRRPQPRRRPRPLPRLPGGGAIRALPRERSTSARRREALETLRRRLRRRSRLRAGAAGCGAAVARRLSPRRHQRSVAVAGGGARLARGRGLARRGHSRPRQPSARCSASRRSCIQLDYEALTKPDPGFRGLAREAAAPGPRRAHLPAGDPRAPPRRS